ncbi:MAG TPA: aldo/keto reductase [Euzebyales bacterium]|nr:aldo/keto reductase [Euzebyales bacterium]
METRQIGDLSVSVVGIGCNNFGRKIDADASAAVVRAALDAGVTFFDTADRYGYGDRPFSGAGRSEEFLGAALAAHRSEAVIATKFGLAMGTDPDDSGGGAAYVRRACDASLRRLGTDYIDLYQIHYPDDSTPIDETLGALTELVQAGKVRVVGCSNFSASQLEEAMRASRDTQAARFDSVQNEYSLLHRDPEADVLPACEKHGVAFLPYFPLASGLLTGKYARGQEAPEGARLAFWQPRDHLNLDDATLERAERLSEFATARGHTPLELAMSWLLARPAVASVTAGATSPEQVRSNAAAIGWTLTREELTELDEL